MPSLEASPGFIPDNLKMGTSASTIKNDAHCSHFLSSFLLKVVRLHCTVTWPCQDFWECARRRTLATYFDVRRRALTYELYGHVRRRTWTYALLRGRTSTHLQRLFGVI